MDFSCEQGGHIVQPHLIRHGQQPVFVLECGEGGRVNVHLKLNLDRFILRYASRHLFIRVEQQEMFLCVPLQEGGADGAFFCLFLFLNLHIQPKGFYFLLQHGKVGGQVKVQILRFQRKIQILGKAVETVEDSQGGSAVERRFFEEARTEQAAEHNFLHDLLHSVLSVVDILYMVAFQHLFNGAVHVKASLKASRASLRSWNDTLRCIRKPYFRPASQSPIPQSANPPSAAGKAPVCSARAA